MKGIEVAVLAFVLNFLSFLLKFFVGMLSSSLAILAESFHSLFDSLCSLTAYFSLKISSKKPDEKHLYGHKRAEPLASIISSLLLLIFLCFVLNESIQRMLEPKTITMNFIILIMALFLLPLNYFIYRLEYSIGKREKSLPLLADSLHKKTDIFLTTSVIISSIGIFYFKLPIIIDPILSIFVSIVLLKNIGGIISDSVDTIIGKSPGREFLRKVYKICYSFDDIKSIHKIMGERIGNHVYLDLHLGLKENISLKKASYICEKLKKEIKKEMKEVKDIIIFPHPYKFRCK
ncbi:MAG: cation diffusion facilitator family transporter [Candidatus Aenigmarchaeota archaeon]|nr:cation diffusion facilitator family transporter [Candidatus Aenigmarchaeota archaeon]MDW8149460.1 cation diffusion facilitator family transporter [Candidatus Aenigmarchaeota archaeon]